MGANDNPLAEVGMVHYINTFQADRVNLTRAGAGTYDAKLKRQYLDSTLDYCPNNTEQWAVK